MRPRLSSAPVFLQVMGLALGAIFATLGITFALVVLAPDPPPMGYSIGDAARALKGEAVRLPNGGKLRARTSAAAPVFIHGRDPVALVIADALARTLAVPPADVRAELRLPRHPWLGEDMRVEVRTMQHLHHQQMRQFQIMVGAPGPHAMTMSSHDGGPMLGGEHLLFPPFAAALRQPDGHWRVVSPNRPVLSRWHLRLLGSLVLTVLLVAPFAYLIARRMTAPIRAFAAAAERLGADPNAPPMTASGPSEVRTATAAFNEMQEKLRLYVEGRTAMLAAIAHDLKTPLTRLRFRADAAPPELRDKLAADVAEMDAMIAAVLAYVRGAKGREDWSLLDLTALVAAVADDFADTGAEVAVTPMPAARVRGDTLALRRLFANLVQNAVKFSGAAEVSLTVEDAAALVRIEDRGPGLAEAELERVFEPFHRGEPSRSRDTGGVGLGLPIARALAREHGGEVTLRRRDGGGLVAEVRLPLA